MNPTTSHPIVMSATCTCVICRKPYIAAKATAEHRGFCTRACEKVLEKKHGLHTKDATFAGRSAKLRAFGEELSSLLRDTPGADLAHVTAAQAKALLMRLLGEVGAEPLFHSELEQQERAVKAASLREIVERAFNPFDDDARAAMLANLFAVAIDRAQHLDEATLRRAIAPIQKASRELTDAWFSAHPAS